MDEAELSEAMRERGLGTPATRAATIELLILREYMERRKKQLHSTALGRSLIGAVAPELRSAELTGRWEAYLKTIERGGGSVERFMSSIEGFVEAVVTRIKERNVALGPMVVRAAPASSEGKRKKVARKRVALRVGVK